MKTITTIMITIILIISYTFTIPAYAEAQNPEYGEFYPRLSIVIEITNDIVVCQDKEGNLWEFFQDEEGTWTVGDLCNLLMWNISQNIELHEVIEVYWEGHITNPATFADW